MICLTFWKALRCFGCHTKGVSFFINCCRGSEAWVMMGENQVVHHSHIGLQLSKVLWGSRVGDGFNFEVVSSQSIRGPCKLKKDVWSTLNWNLWTVHYCPMLCQGHWVSADHALVRKSKWQSFSPVLSPWVLKVQSLLLSSSSFICQNPLRG